MAEQRSYKPGVPYIIVQGNPVDGFVFYGPFPGAVSAVEAADEKNVPEPWCVAELNPVPDTWL